ncbi:uncharacterized protein LOC115226128 isoform X1 [Octopus sinensis]|uniref:Uncharacterized protein LOC115226128 isoform X1 n=1 Tax=Octopus sinensis TaxID=2607531 RepID=A0A6P7TMS4_9MOLL|nr:uncharacterized protein LOC115226128 isoform X1 [Octopus sinensis]
MYSLFQLVRLLTVEQDTDSPTDFQPNIAQFAWRQARDTSLLALVCSNGHLLIYWSVPGQRPKSRLLPWLEQRPIVSLCFDPSATWLLVITTQIDMFIIPALSLMDPQSKVDATWKRDDATHIRFKKPKGFPSALCWWHTLTGYDVAIVGTSLGELVFVNLHTKRVLANTSIQSYIVKLDLIFDDEQVSRHLLVTSKKGSQWQLLLEKLNRSEWYQEIELVSKSSLLTADDTYSNVVSIIDRAAGYQDLFWPVYFPQFGRSIQLSPQYAKGRQLVAAHCCRTCSYQIYDCSIQRSPLYIYKLPLGAHNTVFTDRLIFLNTWQDGKKLFLLANQKAETFPGSEQSLSPESVLQTFDLPCEEKVLGIVKQSYPFYWHDKQESSMNLSPAELMSDLSPYSVPISHHSVLDGCLVITECAVYECRPRISPERYFFQLALHPTDCVHVDHFAVSLGLDYNQLFQLATDHLLTKGHFTHALRLFKMAKSSYVKRVASLASYGCIQEMMTYVQYILKKGGEEVTTQEAKRLSDIALYGFIYLIKSGRAKNPNLISAFREFLLSNFFYNETNALKVLAEWRWPTLLLEVGKARGLIVESLELLLQHSLYNVEFSLWKDLVQKGFGAYLCHVGHGVFLLCLSPEELVDLLCVRPQLAVLQVDMLQQHVRKLDTDRLMKLAEVFDPSKHIVRGHLRCQRVRSERTFSQTSRSSLVSQNFGEMPNPEMSLASTQKMVDFFFELLLLLNKRRDSEMSSANLCRELQPRPFISEHLTFAEEMATKSESFLSLQPSFIGCGNGYVAMVRNGDLYTWGKSNSGCLGHGDLTSEDTVMPVSRVETLHMLKICVTSVTCGGEHILALSSQGVYSWGSSKYGQVGVGTYHHYYTRPMLVESLSSECCVSLVCGQYHSVALTNDGKVFTWGWGVHGQLGHGDAENQSIPKLVSCLPTAKEIRTIQLAAGYAHTMVLSQQGDVYSFGCGYFGQLGLGQRQKKSVPSHITLPEKISYIAANFFSSVAVTQDSSVYCWGIHPNIIRYAAQMSRRAPGQEAADGFGDDYLSPLLVDTSNVLGKIVQVSCGSYHFVLLTSDGVVYTWGRNTDGQLGFVSYQNISFPTQVTAISDVHISHVYSGSDFNVALNSDGEVWGWGRNDTGQLLHLIKEKGVRVRPKAILNRDDVQQGNATHVRVPILLPGVPSAKGGTLYVSHDHSSNGALFDSEDFYQMSQIKIPDLSSVGLLRYGRQVVPVLLRYIPDWCPPLKLLQKCLHQADWKMAITITLHMKQFSQALGFHLMLISETVVNLEQDLLLPLSIQVLDFYISRLLNQEMSSVHRDGCLQFALLQILTFWRRHSLPSDALERFFDQYFDDFAPNLGLLLLREDGVSADQSTTIAAVSSAAMGPTPSAFRQLFTPAYLLKIVANIIEQINTDIQQQQQPPLQQGVWKSSQSVRHKMVSVVKQMVQCFSNYNQTSTPLGIAGTDKSVPYARLWADIVRNVCKMSDTHSYVTLSQPHIQHLLALSGPLSISGGNSSSNSSCNDDNSSSNNSSSNVAAMMKARRLSHNYSPTTESSSSNSSVYSSKSGGGGGGAVAATTKQAVAESLKVVAFTCGHHFLEPSFKNDVLVNLGHAVAKDKRLPRTAALLADCYSKLATVPLACPQCVQQTV